MIAGPCIQQHPHLVFHFWQHRSDFLPLYTNGNQEHLNSIPSGQSINQNQAQNSSFLIAHVNISYEKKLSEQEAVTCSFAASCPAQAEHSCPYLKADSRGWMCLAALLSWLYLPEGLVSGYWVVRLWHRAEPFAGCVHTPPLWCEKSVTQQGLTLTAKRCSGAGDPQRAESGRGCILPAWSQGRSVRRPFIYFLFKFMKLSSR